MGYDTRYSYININDDNIDNIDSNALYGYGQLTSFIIKSNSLTIIDLGIFKGSVNLDSLSFTSSSLIKITNLENIKFPNLKYLSVSGNISKSIEIGNNVINAMRNLTYLELYSQLNPLKPNQLSALTNLKSFEMRTSNQTSITKAMFNGLTSLEMIRLSGNHIKTIDVHTFESMSKLFFLALNSNSITSFEYLQIPKSLVGLLLYENNMNYFALSRTMGVISYLRINDNRFRSFKSMDFTFLANLINIDLSNNPHAYPYEIAGHLKPLVNLTQALLSNLSISSIDADYFKYNRKLELIDLSRNNISRIDNSAFIGLDNLKTIDLSNNPFLPTANIQNLCPATAIQCQVVYY